MQVVIKECMSILEYKDKKQWLMEQTKIFYEAHKEAVECWNNGFPVKAWMDSKQDICIEYENGKWWHYKMGEKDTVVWW